MVSVVALHLKGESLITKQGRGHVCSYPFKDPPAPLRTSERVLENALSAVECVHRVRGFHDVTPLAKLSWFDLVLGIVPDYMHGVLLGVTRQLLNLCKNLGLSNELIKVELPP